MLLAHRSARRAARHRQWLCVRKSYLASEHAACTNFGGTRHACLGSHNGVLADFDIVRYLHQVVEFHATGYVCAAHCGTVDGGVGTDLDIVIDLYDSYLFDLVVMSLAVGANPKPSAPTHGTRMDGAASTYAAAMIHYGARDTR